MVDTLGAVDLPGFSARFLKNPFPLEWMQGMQQAESLRVPPFRLHLLIWWLC